MSEFRFRKILFPCCLFWKSDCCNDVSKKKNKDKSIDEEKLWSTVKRIEFIEEKIKEKINVIANRYVTTKFQEFEKEFRLNLKQINEKRVDALEQFKKVLNKTLQSINNTFNSEGFIRIYSIKSKFEGTSKADEFDLIGNSSHDNDSYKYSKIILQGINNLNENIEKDELLKNYVKYLPSNFNKYKDILRLIIPFTSQMAYLIWKRYENWKEDYREQFSIYSTSLNIMYHSLMEPFIILKSIKLEETLEMSMRLSVHESAQIIPAVINSINNEESLKTLEDGSKYHGNYHITKPAHVIIDSSYRLRLLEGIFRRSTMIFKDEPPFGEWYDIHRIVYATESLFQQRATYDNRQRIILDYNRKLSSYYLFTDYAYLSHILFNLIDNAIKYGLRGSNIYIKADCKYEPNYEVVNKKVINNINISVINYGDEIPELERENIFELYTRSGNRRVEGMGIGLFLVKKLVKLLGYDIECKSDKIENYHLPAKYHYIKQNPNFENNKSFSSNILQYLQKHVSLSNKELIINSDIYDWIIGEMELIELIIRPTYRNEFQITIPIKMNSTNDNLKIKKIWE